jgi:hypothetical protein
MKEITLRKEASPADSKTVKEINRLHDEIMGMTGLQKAIRIGELLSKINEELPHGQWLPWLQANVQFSQKTASNYMRLFEHRDDPKLVNITNLTEAYALLSPLKSGPPPRLSPPKPERELLPALQYEDACEVANWAFVISGARGMKPTLEDYFQTVVRLMTAHPVLKFDQDEQLITA